MRLLKLAIHLITLAAVLGPLVYGLQLHNWDLASLATPRYTPPRVDLDIKHKSTSITKESITMIVSVKNEGELAVTFQDIDAAIYGPDGAELGPAQFEEPLELKPGEEGELKIFINAYPLAIKLIPYFSASPEVSLLIKGTASVKVLGTIASAPMELGLRLSAGQLGFP